VKVELAKPATVQCGKIQADVPAAGSGR